MQERLKIFAGNSNTALAREVCNSLGLALGKALVGTYSDGEIRVEIQENVRGQDVYVFQSTCRPCNQNLIELLILMDALRRASGRRINAVIPYCSYSRQDQKEKPRVPITARMMADMLAVAGAHRVISINLHASQIGGFFNIPVENLFGTEVFLEQARKTSEGNEVVLAPDAAGVGRARKFAQDLELDLAIPAQRSAEPGQEAHIVGQVKNRPVVILDDMVDTGRTLERVSRAAEAAGATRIDAYCVHAVFSGDAVARIERSPLDSLTITDTVPLTPEARACKKIRRVSIAPILGDAIERIHSEQSMRTLMNYS